MHWVWELHSCIIHRSYTTICNGDIKLGNKLFTFKKKSAFPKKPSKEFLIVDLINNLDYLAEDQPKILEKVLKKAMNLDQHSLGHAIQKFGTPRTRKLFAMAYPITGGNILIQHSSIEEKILKT